MRPKKDLYQSFLEYAFRLLARKSYSEAEMLVRLKRRVKKIQFRASLRGEAPAEETEIFAKTIARVMARLGELKYLDDNKILENCFEYRLKIRPQGKYAFLQEMKKRGISVERARAEWEKRGIKEEELALDLLSSKRKQLGMSGLSTIARKKKIAAMLASRGFAPGVIWGILDKNK